MKKLKNYTSIHDIPIKNFFKCSAGDYKYMFITSDYNNLKLTKRISNRLIYDFEAIKDEWDIELSDNCANEMRMKYARILKLRKNISVIEAFIVLLAIQPDDKEIIATLKKMRYNYNPDNPLTSLKQLQGEVNNIKNLIKEIENSLDLGKKSNQTEYDLIAILETAKNGMPIDTEKVVAAQFIAYIKEFRKKQASQSKK